MKIVTLLAGRGAAAPEAPTLTAPADTSVQASYTPELTWEDDATVDYWEVEYGTILTGVPTVSGVATNSYTLPTQTNITRIYWRVRAVGVNGLTSAWSASRYFDVIVYIFRALYETPASAPVSGGDEGNGAWETVGTTARVSIADGTAIIASGGAANTARIPSTIIPRQRGVLFISNLESTGAGAIGFHTAKAALTGYNFYPNGISANASAINDGTTSQTAAIPYTTLGGNGLNALVMLEEGAALWKYEESGDAKWHFLWLFSYEDADMYAILASAATSLNAVSPEDKILVHPYFQSHDWLALEETEVQLSTLYDAVAKGHIRIRATVGTVSGSLLKIKYRYSDSTHYHVFIIDGADVQMKYNNGAGEVDYTTPVSEATVVADGNSIIIQLSMYGNKKQGYIRLEGANSFLKRNLNSSDSSSLNATSTGLVIEASAEWVVTSIEAVAELNNAVDDALQLNPVTSANGILEAATLRNPALAESDGHLHLHYDTADYDFNRIDLNPVTGTFVLASGYGGRHFQGANIRDVANGKEYIHTDIPNQLIEFTIATGASRLLAQAAVGKRPGYVSCIAPDGKIWFGSHTNATPASFNPSGETYTVFPTVAPGGTFIYSIVAAPGGTYIYMQIYLTWEVVVFNASTNTPTVFFTGSGDTAGAFYTKDSDGSIHYKRTLSGGGTQWVEFATDPSTPTNESAPTGVTLVDIGPEASRHGLDYVDLDAGDYEFDISDVVPSSLSTAQVRYRDKIGGSWQTVFLPGIKTSKILPHRVQAFDSTRFLVLADDYGPAYFYAPGTDTMTLGGWTEGNLYGALVDGTDVYLYGYFGHCYRWDTTAEWTLYKGHPDPTSANPREIITDGAKFLYAAKLPNGSICFHAEYVRGSDGSVVHVYNPTTDAVTSYGEGKNGDPYTLADAYPAGMCIVGSSLVLSTLATGNGRVLIIDPSDMSLTSTWTAPASEDDPGIAIPVDSTHALMVMKRGYYLLDITDGAAEWSKTTAQNCAGYQTYNYDMWAENDATAGVIMPIGATLYTINLTTGAATALANPANTAVAQVSSLSGVPYIWSKTDGIIPAQTS